MAKAARKRSGELDVIANPATLVTSGIVLENDPFNWVASDENPQSRDGHSKSAIAVKSGDGELRT
jgi:hypothetical protein